MTNLLFHELLTAIDSCKDEQYLLLFLWLLHVKIPMNPSKLRLKNIWEPLSVAQLATVQRQFKDTVNLYNYDNCKKRQRDLYIKIYIRAFLTFRIWNESKVLFPD